MRHRLRTILDRLGLLSRGISMRNFALWWWLRIADRFRVLAAGFRRPRIGDPYLHVVVPTVDHGRRAVPAMVRADHRASTARATNHELVVDILTDAGVPHRSADDGELIVPTASSTAALAALEAAGPPLFLTADATDGRECGPDRTESVGHDPIVAFVHHTSDRGTATYGAECGVRIHFTDREHAGQIAFPHPIDVVYTWVDGADPEWRRDREHMRRSAGVHIAHDDADTPARFRSLDELRYSIRSIERYAEFVRHVYVVTAGQTPAWLDTRNDFVTVIDHEQIFPDAAMLPTFNSHAIEACLHRIPGLAEHYLYLNDDFLFVRPASADDFFDEDGRARAFRSRSRVPDGAYGKSVDAAAVNVSRAVAETYGVDAPTTKFKHAPYAQRIAVHEEIERRFAPWLATTRAARFRSATDLAVASALHQHVAPLLDLGVVGDLPTGYADLGAPHLRERLRRLAENSQNLTICLNDSDPPAGSESERIGIVHNFLETILPGRSAFEK